MILQIETETKEGHRISNATDYKAFALRQRVELLKRRFTKNKIDVDKATEEAKKANELADVAAEVIILILQLSCIYLSEYEKLGRTGLLLYKTFN